MTLLGSDRGGSSRAGTTSTSSRGSLSGLVVTLTADTTSTTLLSLTITAERTGGGITGEGRSLADGKGGGDDGLGEMESRAEELNTGVGEVVVVVSPVVGVLNIRARLQRLHELNDIQVLHRDDGVLVEDILASNQNSLLEQVGEDLGSVLLGNQHVVPVYQQNQLVSALLSPFNSRLNNCFLMLSSSLLSDIKSIIHF